MKRTLVHAFDKNAKTFSRNNEVDEIFAPIFSWLRVYGLHILDPKWSFKKNSPKIIASILLVLYVLIGTYVFMKSIDDNLLFVIEATFTMVIATQLYSKIGFFMGYRSTFCNVYSFASVIILDRIRQISPEKATKIIVRVRKMVKIFVYLVLLTTLDYVIPDLWHYFHGIRINLSRSTSTLMPDTSPYFELGFFLHLIYLVMVVFGTLMVDLWYIFFVYLYCEACDYTVELLKLEKIKDESDMSYSYRLNQMLGKFYTIHVDLVKYLSILNQIYRWQLLVPLATVLVCICFFLLIITAEEFNFPMVIVMCPVCFEVFIYNILGELIKTKASELNMALLHFDWTNMKVRDRKSYYIIICYMGKEFGIKTAFGVDLSLVTISSILKASYQTYAILNTMKDQK